MKSSHFYQQKVDESIGGWSRDIMSSLIKSNIGISSYIRVIEYPRNFNSIQDTELASGEDECVYLTEWYSSCADIVRRSLIYSITGESTIVSTNIGEDDH